jgi:hypothetical protein
VRVTVVLAVVALAKVAVPLPAVCVQFTKAYPLFAVAEMFVAVPEVTVCAPLGDTGPPLPAVIVRV